MNTPNAETPVILGLNEAVQMTGLDPQVLLSLYVKGLFPAPVFHRPPTWATETVVDWLKRATCVDTNTTARAAGNKLSVTIQHRRAR